MLHLILGAALGLHLSPCTVTKQKIAARCGTFGVYENRAAHSGRIISLRVLVVPATHPSHRAMTWLEGGPGGAAVDTADALLTGAFENEFVKSRSRYDEVFVDARGTGRSHPFPCRFAPPDRPDLYFMHLYSPVLLRQCIEKTHGYADPNQYNTNAAADDLDDVRAALGYKRWVLDGGSYGTFEGLVYIRRHGEHVAGAILDGVTAPGFQTLLGSPQGAQVAYDDLLVKCRRDSVCNSHFPALAEDFQTLLDRLQTPLAITYRHPDTRKLWHLSLSKEVFVDQFRHLLYDPQGVAIAPLIVHRAAAGDYQPLARMIQLLSENFDSILNGGANLSYACADIMPFAPAAEIRAAAAASFAGDLRIRAEQHACSEFNVRPMPAAFNEPVRSNVPILMLNGTDDPATPPQSPEAALRYLPNAALVLVRGAGHGVQTRCTDAIIERFLTTLSTKGIKGDSCSGALRALPFAISTKQMP